MWKLAPWAPCASAGGGWACGGRWGPYLSVMEFIEGGEATD
jgi:hypothetical protein